jgi:simple sugar transport system permease protein
LFDFLNGYITPINQLSDPAGNFRTSSIWFIIVVVLAAFVLTRTRFGNWVYAVGGNQDAALSQGINIQRVKLIAFTLSGLLAGLAGVISFAQRSSMNTLLGEGLELTMVAASVIGGVRLTGGSGTMVGAALGMLLLSMLNQGVVLMGVPNDVFQGIVGAVLIIVVLGNYRLRQEE